ncbi:hypothetical protein [Nostoc sp. PCC 7107]|uniref:hypothetical protein n=1 Tax=Nostoc sp. PCC 7107 TaxID=317936 RepID=UPI00029F44D2|nr:hypothetical protein [Nostoc sp. PCC 7107]AFY45726.1 hypothetical protein Nos7107_5218 [Nostoc sp. PCC 7107]
MTDEISVRLRDARPDDKIHLLLWDLPDETEILRIVHYNNAHHVNYRKNLLQRIHPGKSFLTLHHNLDTELNAIKSMCCGVDKQIILLEGFDCLITYLQVTPGSRITLFWKQLEETRKLEKLLWILLPQQLEPKNWPAERIKRIPSG